MNVTMTVNGEEVTRDIEPRMLLVHYLRDVLGLQIGDGTAQIQKMIIAREKIGRIAVPYD